MCYNVGNKKKGQPKLNQREFLNILSETLNMELTPQEVSENIAYYSSYFAEEAAKGKSEEEVAKGLGDPRMIAKSIIEAARAAQEPYGRIRFNGREYSGSSWGEQQHENAGSGTDFEYQRNGKSYRVSGKIAGIVILVLFLLVVMLLFMLIGGILRLLLPILLPAVLILFGIYLLRQK